MAGVGSGACAARNVVVSLFAAQYNYSAKELPRFEVMVVSTASKPCKVNVGGRYLSLAIGSGRVRAWDSADCLRGAGSHVTTLTRGVPAILHFTWHRKLAAAGCRLPAASARTGTYIATASARTARPGGHAGRLTSDTLIFVLDGRGVAVP